MTTTPTSRVRTCYCGAPAPSGTCPDYPTCTPGWDDKVTQLLTLVEELDRAALHTNSPAVADAVEAIHLALWALEIDPRKFNPEKIALRLIELTATITGLPVFEGDLMCTALCISLYLMALWRGADVAGPVRYARQHLEDAVRNAQAGS